MVIAGVAGTLAVTSHGTTHAGSSDAAGPAVVVQEGRYLYAIALEGSRRVRLAALPLGWSAPALSPDGSRVAYAREGGISVMRLDGTQRRVVTRGQDSSPAWAPDGRTLYFTRTEGGPGSRKTGAPLFNGSIFRVSVGGGKPRRITDAWRTGHCHFDAAISPDGRRIAFSDWTACEGGTSYPRLRVVDSDGQPTTDLRLLPGKRSDPWELEYASPAWSPDGNRLAFRRNSDLAIANRDGSGLRRIVRSGVVSDVDSLLWSPDGVWIAYERYVDDERVTLFIVHPDGAGFRRLRTVPYGDWTFAGWLPALPK
jgi:Tol biopolymer transport system component